MKFKKRIAPILAGALVGAIALTSTASAHPYDYYSGKYIGQNGADLLLRISTSAQTDLLNWTDVYSAGYNWNNISSKVNVRLIYSSSGMPSFSGEMLVVGKYYEDDTLGETIFYDSNGNPMKSWDDYALNTDWSYSQIYMSTNTTYFKETSNPSNTAKMTFLHEIGHALKLSHPYKHDSLPEHTINGLPIAIMNQGAPGDKGGATSGTITAHDKSNLIAKWGA